MHLDKEQARELWNKYLNGNCSEEERRFVETWYNQAIDEQIGIRPSVTRMARFRPYYLAAALIVTAFAFGFYFYFLNEPNDNSSSPASHVNKDIQPGGNKAQLTLANGQRIQLSGEKEGLIITGNEMTYSDGSSVVGLDNKGTGAHVATQTLRLSTPKGGQYHIILSDGTKVWLNSASALTYPAVFDGNDREVILEGEGFFSVDNRQSTVISKKPFIVTTRGQKATVLGTEFNISAYADETAIKTTLLSGSVKITVLPGNTPDQSLITSHQSLILKPNEQSIFTATGIEVKDADIESSIAWKNGLFHFENTSLEDMMKQISRWYDLDVRYADGVPQARFTGKMRRNLALSEVLSFLKGSDIQFKTQGKTLIIYKQPNNKN